MAHRQDTAAAIQQALEAVPDPANKELALHARRAEAVSMALAGLTYEQIGSALGISASGALELVKRTMETTRNYAVDQLRLLENARLDRAQAAIWSKVLEGDLAALDRYLRISRERRALNGMDAPTRIQMQVAVRQEMETALAALEEIVLDAEVIEEADVVVTEAQAATEHEYLIDPMAGSDD